MGRDSGPIVIVPAFNEVECIAGVVDDVRSAGYRVVVVDDGSSDRTAAAAGAAGAVVIRLPINLGVGGAMRTGFRYAVDHCAPCVIQVDADGQHEPGQIEALLAELERSDADLVIGSRFASGGTYEMSVVRRWCIGVLAAAIRRSGGIAVTDPTSGFRAIRSPLLEAFAVDFPQSYLGDTFEATLVAARQGYRITEVPVTMRQRQGGSPSADLFGLVRAMTRALTILLTGPSIDLPARPA